MTEDQLEQQCLAWFAEGGWEIVQTMARHNLKWH